VTVHEKRRVNEEQPTPASSPSRKSRQRGAQTTPAHLHCTGVEPIHQVHGSPKPRAHGVDAPKYDHISTIFPPFYY